MEIYMDDYTEFDWDEYKWFSDTEGDIWYAGCSDDWVHWTVCPGWDKQFRVTMCKPGYDVTGKFDDWGPDYDDPVMVEEFDYIEDVASFVGNYASTNW